MPEQPYMKPSWIRELTPNQSIETQREFLIQCYASTWEDVHHSRNQDWKFLEIIALIFIAMIGVSLQEKYDLQKWIVTVIGASIILLCIFGFIMAQKHLKLFKAKMQIVSYIEYRFGLNFDWKTNQNRKNQGSGGESQLGEPSKEKFSLKVSNVIEILYGAIILAAGAYILAIHISAA